MDTGLEEVKVLKEDRTKGSRGAEGKLKGPNRRKGERGRTADEEAQICRVAEFGN